MKKLLGLILMGTLLSQMPAAAQPKERSEIDDKYKWDLTDLYETEDDWNAEKERLAEETEKVTQFKGKLGNSAQDLLACLEFNAELGKELTRLYLYAMMNSDLDTRNNKYQGMKQELELIYTNYGSMASYIEPEILEIDKAKIDKFIAAEEGLKVYEFYLNDLQRTKEHMLSEAGEKILAEAGLMAGTPDNVYSILSNADLPYPEVELSDGSKVTLNSAGYARTRGSENRGDREMVFDTFFNTLKQYRDTFGSTLAGAVNTHKFYARTRKYENSLESALDRNNIPTSVYKSLIKGVNDNLDAFHRYLDIKKRMLGVDQLKYSDLYAPTVEGVDLAYTIDEANETVLKSLKPLGKDYIKTVQEAIDNRWIDVYPTPGKRSGAYSAGDAYDVHPYILLNFNGKYNDVSTLAHELGHTMHSYYSNKTQPYPLADYSIFVAEVASTFNEALLMDHVMDTIKDDDVKLSLLMEYLDGVKGTLFRQTQFAEFELRIHELSEEGKALTGESLSELYGDIVRRYYGHDKGVCEVDDIIKMEWAYIPHFYYNFYVYQYSTSFCASTALSEKVLNKEKGAKENYINFISSGGSDYPIELLKNAGVDMTTSDPFDKTIVKMNRVMDEIEKILEKKGI